MPQIVRPTRPSLIQEAGIAPPFGGINMLSPAVAQEPTDCVYCYNMTARELGLGPRLGSYEFANGLDGPVRSILSFNGSTAGLSQLFVTTQTGIWRATAGGASVKVYTFLTQDAGSGYGISTGFVDLNAGHSLLYADESNGYLVYNEGPNTWTKVTRDDVAPGTGEIGGLDPDQVAFVMTWKNRVWLVKKGTGEAYYLPINSMYGQASKFAFGSRFRSGGELVGLWNWTDGNAQDDQLVAISRGGDVVIYQGSDPAYATTFGIRGTWSVGDVPAGRQIASNFGGDLLIISALGAIPLSKLVISNQAAERTQYATQKIPTLINSLMSAYKSQRGWSVVLSPEDNTLLVLTPQGVNQPTMQLVMNLSTKGWSSYRGLKMSCAAAWGGKLYYGTTENNGTAGRVMVNSGTVDGLMLADVNVFSPIEFSLLTSFQEAGTARNKHVELIRTTFQNPGGHLQFQTKAVYGYNIGEMDPLTFLPVPTSGDLWDTALWDTTGRWAGSGTPVRGINGAVGLGPEFAIAMRGLTMTKAVFLGWHVFYQLGGQL